MKPFDLHGLKTCDLSARPSKVFVEDLGDASSSPEAISQWVDSLPRQLAANSLRKVRDRICAAHEGGHTIAVAMGGHVIKTGCGPYLVDLIRRGVIRSVSMNGSAAIHDLELAVAGKTSEDVAAQLPGGHFGMARETADAFAIASQRGAINDKGLGRAIGEYLHEIQAPHRDVSVVAAAAECQIPCTVHVALGTDIVHMHPHVSGAALGESSMIDFRILCSVVSSLADGVWMNLGSAVIMPEVFLKAVSVVRNFGHSLDGLTAVNVDKESRYRTLMNVMNRPASEGLELIGHHELLLPLLHAAVVARIAMPRVSLRAA